VVDETPWSDQGEITENPTPRPNATKIIVTAIAAVLPAKIAFQLTADWASSTNTFPVFAIMAPSLLRGGKNFHPHRLPNT
jgi:hypothetical protein